MAYLIIIGLAIAGLVGLGMKFHAQGVAEGRAACQAELKAADDRLAGLAAKLETESANHITDMEAAYEQGEKEKAPYVVTRVVRAQADAAATGFPSCALPAAALANLNAARLSMRRETVPPAPPTPVDHAPAPAALVPATAPPASPARAPLGKRP